MKDIAYLLLAGYIGFQMGKKANNKKPPIKRFPTMKDCPTEIPGLKRHTRTYPVIAQDINLYRNIYDNPYNFPQ